MDILDQIAEEANKATEQNNNVEQPQVDDATEQTEVNNNPVEGNNTEAQTEEVADNPKEEVKSVFASDKVAELNAYLAKNPDKDISDWQMLKKPTSELDQNELLRQYYSDKEGLTEKEIEYRMKQIEVGEEESDDFDDFGDDTERLKREAERERELRKAREWREAYVSEQLSGSTEQPQQNVETFNVEEFQKQVAEQQQKAHEAYLEKIYKALPELQTIDLDINGEKVSYVPDEEFIRNLRNVAEHPETLWQNYQNPDGSLKDPKGWLEILCLVNPVTREKLSAYRVEQAILRDRAANGSQKRNVSQELNTGTVAKGTAEEEFAAWYNSQNKQQF